MNMSDVSVVSGDLLDQDVEAIVNPWNFNLIPWWLLVPSGVIRLRKGDVAARLWRPCSPEYALLRQELEEDTATPPRSA